MTQQISPSSAEGRFLGLDQPAEDPNYVVCDACAGAGRSECSACGHDTDCAECDGDGWIYVGSRE